MEIQVAGKQLRLEARHLLGSGGEANVFARNGEAFKIFHTPSALKEEKLRRLITKKLPGRILAPKELAFSKSGRVIGYTMPLANPSAEPLKMLANRNFRQASQIEIPQLVRLYGDFYDTLAELHRLGVVVGDLNDLNELFLGEEVYFIDSDSFQLDGLSCEVATEDYLCPALYDLDLRSQVAFTPESDWYSYSVLLYRSLLMVHPYGGVYPTTRKLTERARQRVTALDPRVKYPKIGMNPEALSDEMLTEFYRIFKEGRYGVFPREVLEDFGDQLRVCPSCGQNIWAKRKKCPICSRQMVIPIKIVSGSFLPQSVLETSGNILFAEVSGARLYAIAEESVHLFLLTWQGAKTKTRLFENTPNLEFGMAGRKLVVAKKGSPKLVIVEPNTGEVITTTETELYTGKPVFSGTERYLYRVASGYLLRGQIVQKELREKPLTGVLSGQTWFVADDQTGQERIFLAGRYFANWDFRLVVDEEVRDLEITSLSQSEKLIRATVRFGRRETLFLRETKKKGKSLFRFDLVTDSGKLLADGTEEWGDEHEAYFEGAYSQGVLVYTTDDGFSAFKPQSGERWTLAGTEKLVKGGERLIAMGNKLISITEKKVTLLEKRD